MKIPHALGGLALALALGIPAAPTAAQPQPAAPAVDVEQLGPKIGEKVPDFTLHDQTGQPRALSSLLGPKGAVLVFFRSADW